MDNQSINVLGLDITFKANTDSKRIGRALDILEKRFHGLKQQGTHMSKERLLVYLAIALADDFVVLHDINDATEQRLKELLSRIENKVVTTTE